MIRRHQRMLGLPDEDPLGSVANLFDAAVVLALGIMLALVAQKDALSELASRLAPASDSAATEDVSVTRSPLDRPPSAPNILRGEGQRLGVAYRLKDGAIVYVPDESSP